MRIATHPAVVLTLGLFAALMVPTATADDLRVVAYCDFYNWNPPNPPVGGVGCGATVKQTDRSCQVIAAGVGYCLYTSGGVGVGAYGVDPLIPTVCVAGEDCYGAQAGLWTKDGIYMCVVRVETPGDDFEPCVTFQ